MGLSEELERLAQLCREGVLSEAEFTAAKARLLADIEGGRGFTSPSIGHASAASSPAPVTQSTAERPWGRAALTSLITFTIASMLGAFFPVNVLLGWIAGGIVLFGATKR
jgi:hypothetical protein